MTSVDYVDRQLGAPARLISAADREWLAREVELIELRARKLAEVEKRPSDFAAMSFPLSTDEQLYGAP